MLWQMSRRPCSKAVKGTTHLWMKLAPCLSGAFSRQLDPTQAPACCPAWAAAAQAKQGWEQ